MQNVTQFSQMDRIQFNLDFIKSDPQELYPQFNRRLFNAIWFLTPFYLKTLTVKDVIIWLKSNNMAPLSESLSQWKHCIATQIVLFIFLFLSESLLGPLKMKIIIILKSFAKLPFGEPFYIGQCYWGPFNFHRSAIHYHSTTTFCSSGWFRLWSRVISTLVWIFHGILLIVDCQFAIFASIHSEDQILKIINN